MNKPESQQNNSGKTAEENCCSRQSGGILTSLSGRLLLGLCLLEFVLVILLVTNRSHPASEIQSPEYRRSALSGSSNAEPYLPSKPGPWGNLEYARIAIEPPDDFVPAEDATFEKSRWFFGGYTRERLTNFFNSCDLTAAQLAGLLTSAAWTEDTNGLIVTPAPSVIFEMSQPARTQIYSALAKDGRNTFQVWPYTFRDGGFDQLFQKSRVSDTTVALVKRLLYSRGASICFSDLPEVFAQIPTLSERRQLLKTLSRNSTILMKLRVKPDSDIQALTTYWTGDWRAKDIEPLLNSLTEIPGGMTIDIAHLLPPFARKRLNTYPTPDAAGRWPDCYWSTLNFFNDPPDDRYYDDQIWARELATNHTAVTRPTYGDAIFLLRSNDIPVHAAVYIADDVVFTKNGGNYRQPWILMKWDDLLARYPESASLHTVIFRSNKRMKQP